MGVLIGSLGPTRSLQFSQVLGPCRGGSQALSPYERSLWRQWRRNPNARLLLHCSLQLYFSFCNRCNLKSSLEWHWRLYAQDFFHFPLMNSKCKTVQKLIFIISFFFSPREKTTFKWSKLSCGLRELCKKKLSLKEKKKIMPTLAKSARKNLRLKPFQKTKVLRVLRVYVTRKPQMQFLIKEQEIWEYDLLISEILVCCNKCLSVKCLLFA